MAARRLSRSFAPAFAAAALTAAGAAAAPVVHFGWDRDVLTPEEAAAVRGFLAAYDLAQVSRVVVVGHADASGEAAYNHDLSLRRARTVAGELARLGVDPGVILVQGRGEAEPVVPTPDGRAEPLNRRAEIVWLK